MRFVIYKIFKAIYLYFYKCLTKKIESMSLVVKINRSFFPSFVGGFFDNDLALTSNLFGFNRGLLNSLNATMPSVNITEDEKSFRIELAAPGLEKKDFQVVAENGKLTISSKKEKETKEEKENYCRREYSYNSFSRSFQLPENSLPDKIGSKYENGILKFAEYKNGVLILTLPKKELTITNSKKEIKFF